jgi:ribosomal protein S14
MFLSTYPPLFIFNSIHVLAKFRKHRLNGLNQLSTVEFISYLITGRAIAQAASRWLPTAAARVRVRAACGRCGGHSGVGTGFLRVLRFPLPIFTPPIFSTITITYHLGLAQ